MGDRDSRQDKRELRRRRRVRNQIIAYTVLVVMILMMAAGIVFGVQFLTENWQGEESPEQESEEIIKEILASEEEIATPEPTPEIPEVVEPTPEEILDAFIDEKIQAMPLEDKVAGLFIVVPEDITGVTTVIQAGDGTRQALEKYPVGGLVYFKKNIKSEEQLRTMLENTASYAKYPLFLAVDEEGGTLVSRILSEGLGPAVDSAEAIGATGDPQNAYQAGVTIGTALAGFGFNLDFAPVADVANVEDSIMKARSYGSDAGTVAEFVTSAMAGIEEQNVTACLKHFPGLGSTTQDTHNGMVSTDRTAEQFWAEELTVFQAGINAGANMIMVGHMSAPELTGDNDPCIFSRVLVTDILREQMDYDGVIVTDALNMAAISEYYGAGEAACRALLAGCDMLLMPEDFEQALAGVIEAVQNGNIDEERINDSLKRVYRIKYADMDLTGGAE